MLLSPAIRDGRGQEKNELMWNKDEVKGKAEQAKGRAKETVGKWTDNDDLEAEGQIDRATGEAREAVGAAKRKTEEAADEVRKHLPKP